MAPQPGGVFRLVAIAKLDGVTPHYQLSLKVDLTKFLKRRREKVDSSAVDINYSHPF